MEVVVDIQCEDNDDDRLIIMQNVDKVEDMVDVWSVKNGNGSGKWTTETEAVA